MKKEDEDYIHLQLQELIQGKTTMSKCAKSIINKIDYTVASVIIQSTKLDSLFKQFDLHICSKEGDELW